MNFPHTYGEILRPLDVNQLPEPLLSQYRSIPRVKEWVHLVDRVRRTEKISSWTQWTNEESAAYEAKDYRLFSRLRGYSDSEIQEFERLTALTIQVDQEMEQTGETEFCINAEWAIQQIVQTKEFEEVQAGLRSMSDVARAHRQAAALAASSSESNGA